MNGAMAEPLVRTISPPKMAIITNTGNSQNFFRILKKAQNSRIKLINDASKLVLECFWRSARGCADNPIALGCRLEFPSHRVFTTQPHQEADGNDAGIEQYTK
jgi:hypothetical protein